MEHKNKPATAEEKAMDQLIQLGADANRRQLANAQAYQSHLAANETLTARRPREQWYCHWRPERQSFQSTRSWARR